jgi:hypothetical protein
MQNAGISNETKVLSAATCISVTPSRHFVENYVDAWLQYHHEKSHK